MAKQSFTTGQVLLASQLTSLQQTALGGGAASAKVASYTLVAADAGTAISMTNASATTITVNTGLFSAGDTVLLQNLGAGVCTVTAGSATVNTAGSLALAQYEAGVLYFVSASAAVLFDYTQTAAASPLTTKGDIYTRNSSADARLPVGTNGQVLTADSSEATGLKFATPSSGGKVLQVIQATTETPQTIASTSFTDLTSLSVSITPSSASSKVLCMFSSFASITRGTNDQGHFGRLLRGVTAVNTLSLGLIINAAGITAVSDVATQVAFMFLDSPSTTSATTYKMQARVAVTANSGSTTYQRDNGVGSLIVMEIGA